MAPLVSIRTGGVGRWQASSGYCALGVALAALATACDASSPPPSAPPAASATATPAAVPTAAPTPPLDPPSEQVLTVSAVGDCAIGDLRHGAGAPGSFRARLAEVPEPLDYPFSGVATILRSDDLTIANLEGTLTSSHGAVNPVFAIRGEPGYAAMLRRGGVELVNIENNHSHDYGLAGFADTKAALEQSGTGYFGGQMIDRRTVRGLRVVNLGYLGGPVGTRARMTKDVERERVEADLVIVSFHWGVEASPATHPDQQRLGRAAIDAGADWVLGHHPHVLQGIERYRDRHIVYSLGNFVFGANSQPADMDSMIVQGRFRFRERRLVGVDQRVIPVRISTDPRVNDFRPIVLEGAERERVLRKIERLNGKLAPPHAGHDRAVLSAADGRDGSRSEG